MYIINPPKRQQCRWPQEQPELWLSLESSLCLTSLFLFMSVWLFLVSLVLPAVPWHRQLWIHILEFTISWIQAILIPASASSSPEFLMMYSAYKLNKQGDNIQPWRTPFRFRISLLFHASCNCCFLTCTQVSQETGQVVWYSHLFKNFPQCVVIHTVKGLA